MTTPASTWPYVLFGYGVLATIVPWTVGGFVEGEFGIRSSLLLGVFFALPLWVSARWLETTPYHLIGLGCWVLVALWIVHLLVSVFASLRKKSFKAADEP